MHNLLNGLNEAQREAVQFGEGPALVLAGPGSGKTTVIVKRILYLIEVLNIPPEEILVVTFTKEAAKSMQERFLQQINGTCPVHFGTFHSVFYHILLDFDSNQYSKILTHSQKKEFLLKALNEVCIKQQLSTGREELLTKVDAFLGAISFYKNTLDLEQTTTKLPEEFRNQFEIIFESYRRLCREECGIDFDDMVYECKLLLEQNPLFLKKWQERFRFFLVDEFQDINPIQYEVMELLCQKNPNIFVVGDEDQSIYGFRGSKPECIQLFAQEHKAKQILLNANYRSSAQIVRAADCMIAENQNRILANKTSVASGSNAQIDAAVKLSCFETVSEQNHYICAELKGICRENMTCGVLFRTNLAMQSLACLLLKSDIAFEMKEKVNSVYAHFIVQDIMAYLKLSRGQLQRKWFLQIQNKPMRGIKRECLGDMERVDVQRLLARATQKSEIMTLQRQLEALGKMSLSPAIRYICKAIGYEAYLKSKKEAKEHWQEWMELLDFLKEDAKNYETLEAWEEAQMKLEKQLEKPIGPKRFVRTAKQNCKIELMTVHASKGLEFDKVFIPDCNEKMYPHGSMLDKQTIEEERRIFYVAMTRAKKDLELLCVTGIKERPRQMSRFLNPILHQLSRQTHSYQDTHQKHQ